MNYPKFSDSSKKELEKNSVIEKYSTTASDGKKYNTNDKYLLSDDRDILKDAGKISHEIAEKKALTEFEKYRVIQDRSYKSDFDKLMEASENYRLN